MNIYFFVVVVVLVLIAEPKSSLFLKNLFFFFFSPICLHENNSFKSVTGGHSVMCTVTNFFIIFFYI